jgi:hypothetical protein
MSHASLCCGLIASRHSLVPARFRFVLICGCVCTQSNPVLATISRSPLPLFRLGGGLTIDVSSPPLSLTS